VRLPFPRGAEDRKDVKTLIVEMTQTSLANPVVQEAMQAVVEEDARKEKAKAAA
jgi:phosphoribosylformylglycinamidine (FGAM) synthase PurS component